MEYRVEELAAHAGVAVDTVRYYQARGLLPAPRRVGRVALYADEHLARLRRIRELAEQGFKLAQIERLVSRDSDDEALLGALVEQHVGGRTYTRAELAQEAGVPEALLVGAETAGLIQPIRTDAARGPEDDRFTESDLQMARAGMDLLKRGLPIAELLELAQDHARNVEAVAERAIDLFDDNVRKARAASPRAGGSAAEAFQALLPQVTRLVALHFQRTLVGRALDRLADTGGDTELRDALTTSQGRRLAVEVEWR